MNANAAMAWMAFFALVLSLISLVWQWRSGEDRKTWEAEQDRTRQRWTRELQGAQNKWQGEQTTKQVERETVWRQEENDRLAAWREEDISRQEDSAKPKLDVKLNPGFQMNPVSGLSETLLFTEARNVGTVPVYFSNWGGFVLPDGKLLDWPLVSNPNLSKHGTNFDPSQPLMPASSCKTYVELNTLKKWLAKEGYTGVLEIQGYFTDALGTKHLSHGFPLNVDDD